MENPVKVIETTVEDVVDEVEGVFSAKPGGMVDRHRKERARREAAEEEARNISERIEEYSYKAVKTVSISPEVFSATTYTVLPGNTQPVLPLGPYRSRATILVPTPSGSCILAKDSGAAISGNGFFLPPNVPVVLTTRSQVWAFNNTGETIQISVMFENYGPEEH